MDIEEETLVGAPTTIIDQGVQLDDQRTDKYLQETLGLPLNELPGRVDRRSLAAKRTSEDVLDVAMAHSMLSDGDLLSDDMTGIGENEIPEVDLDEALGVPNDLFEPPPPREKSESEETNQRSSGISITHTREGEERPMFSDWQCNLRSLIDYNREKAGLSPVDRLSSRSEGKGVTHKQLQALACKNPEASAMVASVKGDTQKERVLEFSTDIEHYRTIISVFPDFDPADESQWSDGARTVSCVPCARGKCETIMAGLIKLGFNPSLGVDMVSESRVEVDLSDPIQAKSASIRTLKLCGLGVYMIMGHYPGIVKCMAEKDDKIYMHPNMNSEIHKASRYALACGYWAYACIRDLCKLTVDEVVSSAYSGLFKMSEEEENSEMGTTFGPKNMKDTLTALAEKEQLLLHVFGTGFGEWAKPSTEGVELWQWEFVFVESGIFIWRAFLVAMSLMLSQIVDHSVKLTAEHFGVSPREFDSNEASMKSTVERDVACIEEVANGPVSNDSSAASDESDGRTPFNIEYARVFQACLDEAFASRPLLWTYPLALDRFGLDLTVKDGEKYSDGSVEKITLRHLLRNMSIAAAKMGCKAMPLAGDQFLDLFCGKKEMPRLRVKQEYEQTRQMGRA